MPATAKAMFKRMECVNITITGSGVDTQQHAGAGPHVMNTCPPSFQGHAKLAMCMATPLYGFATIGCKIAQWLEFYTYAMNEDVHFYLYAHRYGTPAVLQGWMMLKPYVDAGLLTIVWESEWATARFYEANVVPYVGAPRGSLHGGPLHAGRSTGGRSTRAAPQGVAPHGPLHGWVADIFYTDVRSILMDLWCISKAPSERKRLFIEGKRSCNLACKHH